MSFLPYSLVRKLLFAFDAENVHERTIALLKYGHGTPLQYLWQQDFVADPITLAGLQFPNRVGLAAGLDKNACCIDALGSMGFGFVEVGTVTPRAQAGNPKPRIFRLEAAQAIINRMGFNNDGLDAFIQNVQKAGCRQANKKTPMLLGLNIGKNAATPIENAAADYLIGLRGVYPHADYVVVNISSPNTQNLRSLQSDAALDYLLSSLAQEREKLADTTQRRVPLFVKIAPDLDVDQINAIAAALQQHQMDGVIATNTTLARSGIAHLDNLPHAHETGGLSGAPLLAQSNEVIRLLRLALGADFPIIGAGGILKADDACSKIKAGADAVQIYTGLIYEGSNLVHQAAQAIKQMQVD